MDISKVIFQSLTDINPWLTSSEMAFIAMNGGYEQTVRDRLMYKIQKRMPENVVMSERRVENEPPDIVVMTEKSGKKSVERKRPDIAIFQKSKENEKKKALALIELKTNFSFQKKLVTGKVDEARKTVPNQEGKSKKAIGRVESDIEKWSHVRGRIPLGFIQIVSRIEQIPDDIKPFMKYRDELPEKTKGNIREIKDYFCELKCALKKDYQATLKTHEVKAVSKCPDKLVVSLTFFILVTEPKKNK
ncbi:MAG: hypothetical protein KAW12_10600 [Candidatus Aminicenantes bacterium]|nr:hypothetical protein [Candidatus Aminicenantes bacterium]